MATVAIARRADATVAEKTQQVIDLLGGLDRLVQRGSRVLIKPNFVAPFEKAVTNFDLIRTVVAAVRAAGGVPVIGESSGFEFHTATAFKVIGADKLAEELDVELVNFDEAEIVEVTSNTGPLRRWQIAREVLEADCLINLPKLKGHTLTRVTFGLKNLMGTANRRTRRRMHVKGLSRTIPQLNRIVRPSVTIVDALEPLARAVFSGRQALGVVLASRDTVAVDRVCCGLLGVDEREIGHIANAMESDLHDGTVDLVGDGLEDLPQVGLQAESRRRGLHRAAMWVLYAADGPWSRLARRSLIPRVHYALAVRPHLVGDRCTRCGVCVEVCPADAIDLNRKRIIASRCRLVRCMKCVEACPEGAIRLRGLRKPDEGAT